MPELSVIGFQSFRFLSISYQVHCSFDGSTAHVNIESINLIEPLQQRSFIWWKAWESNHIRTSFVGCVYFPSSVASFVETSSCPTTYSMIGLTCDRRKSNMLQQNETFKSMVSSCTTVVFVCSAGRQLTRGGFPTRVAVCGMLIFWRLSRPPDGGFVAIYL